MVKGKQQLSKEEELLLEDFSRNISKRSSVFFYGVAFVVSVIPLWLFWRIHQMDPKNSAILFIIGTAVTTYLIAFAYRNVKFVLKHKIAQKRDDNASREMIKKITEADVKKSMTRKEKDERILWKKNEVADYEATTLSIFYNNTLFIVLVIVLSFFLLKSLQPSFNYMLSVGIAGGLIALLSTGSQ